VLASKGGNAVKVGLLLDDRLLEHQRFRPGSARVTKVEIFGDLNARIVQFNYALAHVLSAFLVGVILNECVVATVCAKDTFY
jgi:hypothetical protein